MHMTVDPQRRPITIHKILQIAGEGRGQQVARISGRIIVKSGVYQYESSGGLIDFGSVKYLSHF